MKILFIGDIVGRPGRETVKKLLPGLKAEYHPDLILANGENLSHGKGTSLEHAEEMLKAGIDFLTGGNHSLRDKTFYSSLDNPDFPAIRPANYPVGAPGKGYKIINTYLLKPVLVINLQGRVFSKDLLDCPFRKFDQIYLETKYLEPAAIIVDFHAEATSEKVVFGHYVDGRVSAVFGTHTHVPTADARLLPKKTAYITDVGMTGLKESAIGVDLEPVIKNFLLQIPVTHDIANTGQTILQSALVEIDDDGRAVNIQQIIRSIDG